MNAFAFLRVCNPVWRTTSVIGKICRRCKEWRALDRFHRNHKMRDGHLNVCKRCRCG